MAGDDDDDDGIEGTGGGGKGGCIPVRVIRCQEQNRVIQRLIGGPKVTVGEVLKRCLGEEGASGVEKILINGVWDVPMGMQVGPLWYTLRMEDRFLYICVR